jgi:energy-coupling factor transport system permease protein
MAAELNLYVRRHTWLYRLDPRVKLLFILDASLLLFLWPGIWTATAVILFCTAVLWQAQVPAYRIVRVWQMMGPVMLMVFALTALFGGGASPPWFQIGPLVVTTGAVQLGAMLALRLLALSLVVFLWLFTTDQATMVRGFLALRMPYEWGLTLALALRYLPLFARLFVQVREAQQARGLDLQQRRFWQRLRSYRPVLVAMVISALRQSEHLGWALEARGLGGQGIRRTGFRPLRFRRADVLVTSMLTGVLLVTIILRIFSEM